MKNAIIIGVFVIIVSAFIVGAFMGNADDRDEAKTDAGAQDLQGFKLYTTGGGIKQEMDKLTLTIPEAERATFYSGATSSTLKPDVCGQIAQDIWDSKGYAWDDEENKVIGALKQLTSLMDLWKTQLMFDKIVNAPTANPLTLYIQLHDTAQKNIIGYMQNFLSDEEQTKCAEVLKKLPLCIVKGKKYNIVKS